MASGKLTAKDIWQEQNRRRAQADKDRKDASAAAHRAALSQYKEQKSALDAELSSIEQARADAERRKLTKPKRILVGATTNNRSPIFVWHWLVEPPKDLHVGVRRKGMGLLLALVQGGGALDPSHAALTSMRRANPNIDTDYPQFIEAHRKALTESYERYGKLLAQLRDDALMAKLFEASDVCLVDKDTKEVQGQFGTYKRDITTVDVPTLTAVDIEPDGLVLTYENRSRDSAKRWSSSQRIDLLKNLFRKLGVNSSNLRIMDDPKTADIKLYFDDSPSAFPAAVAFPLPEPARSISDAKKRFADARWVVGVDSRGNTIMPTIKSTRHCIAAGQPGVGKSVWVRSVIAQFQADGWEIYLGDGKGSDYASLAEQPNVRMVSAEPAQHLLLVAEVCAELERRRAEAKVNKRVDPHPYNRYTPILLALDEFGTMKDEIDELDPKKGLALFMSLLARIIKVGREARVVVLLAAQDVYADTIPVALQNQFGLAVLLGVPGERTVSGDFVPEPLREEARRIGGRLTKPGRGMYIDRDAHRVVEVQTPYSYSAGSTPLDAAPTSEVREIWQQSKLIADSLPYLYPRLGIKTDHDWRESGADAIAATEVVAITNEDGGVAEGMEKYDPLSDDWVGGERVGMLKPRPAGFGEPPVHTPAPAQADTSDSAPGQATTASPAEVSPTGDTNADTEYTADSLREVLVEAAARARQEAARRGLVLPSDIDDDDGDL